MDKVKPYKATINIEVEATHEALEKLYYEIGRTLQAYATGRQTIMNRATKQEIEVK